jgi:hypothetical protein
MFAIGVLLATATTQSAYAQTQDITGSIESYEATVRTQYRKLRSALKQPCAVGYFSPQLNLREAMLAIQDGMNAGECPVLSLEDEYRCVHPLRQSTFDLPIRIPLRRGQLSAEELLDLGIAQFPGSNVTWVLRGNWVIITAKRTAAARRAHVLGELRRKVDTRYSEPRLSLEETLAEVHGAIRDGLPIKDFGSGFAVICDTEAFQAEGLPRFDPTKVLITLPPREAITVGEILDIVVSQIPGRDADYVVLPYSIEVTTRRRAAVLRERLFR